MLSILLVFGAYSNLSAQNNERKSAITFEQFKDKISGISIPGFLAKPQIEEEEDEDTFQATFTKGKDLFIVKIEARHYPPGWTGAPYKLNGKNAEFGTVGQLAMLIIDLPETYSVLTLISNNIKDKATFENIAIKTGFMNMAQESAPWPLRIPVDYRLNGVLLESSESKDCDAGFSFQVKVEMVMCDMLKQSLIKMANKYENQGDFLRFPNGIILNFSFSEIDSIDDMYKNNDIISFIYYIP